MFSGKRPPILYRVVLLLGICLTYGSLLFAQPFQLSRQYLFEKIGQPSAISFLEGQLGFMWVGANGLYRYTGHELRPFPLYLDDTTRVQTGVINSLLEDTQGRILIGASSNLYRYDRRTDRCEQLNLPQNSFARTENGISTLQQDRVGRIWIGTEQHLLVMPDPEKMIYDTISGIHIPYRAQIKVSISALWESPEGFMYAATRNGLYRIGEDYCSERLLPADWDAPGQEFMIFDAAPDSQGRLWLATSVGLWYFDSSTYRFHRTRLPESLGKIIQSVAIGPDDVPWFGIPRKGLFALRNDELLAFSHQSENAFGLGGDRVRSLYFDRFGGLWISTLFLTQRLHLSAQRFPFYQIVPGPGQTHNFVHRVLQDSLGGLWFRMLNHGLGYSRAPGDTMHLLLQPQPRTPAEEIKNFCVDVDGNVWVITLTYGLFRFRKGSHVPEQIDIGDSLRTAFGMNIMADQRNDRFIWLTTHYGLCRVDRFTHERRWFAPSRDLPGLRGDPISNLVQTAKGDIWCTIRFVDHLCIVYFDYDQQRFVAGLHRPHHPEHIQLTVTEHFQRVPGGKIWLGVSGGVLIVDEATHQFTFLTQREGLPVRTVRSIVPDHEGNIWFTGEDKICRFDGLHYQCYSGQADIEAFNKHSATSGSDGRLTFGGKNGIYSFYPDQIDLNPDTVGPQVFLTEVTLFGEPLRLGQATELTKHITLKHQQNLLALRFSAPHFLRSDQLTYRYRLESFQEYWSETRGEDGYALYDNLPPGTYLFHAYAINADGYRTAPSDELRISLTVLPPWYRSSWAYLAYLMLGAGLLFGIRRYEIRRQAAQAEAKRLQELEAVKTRLYTNLTHEFRTPLTIITGLAKRLQQQVDHELRADLQRIGRSGRQLLRLVNQLLDLSRIEHKRLPLHWQQIDIIAYCRYVIDAFASLVEERQLRIHFAADVPALFMDVDSERLGQIVGNLLSNAIKFTPSGGTIQVKVTTQENITGTADQVCLTVQDTGRGIAAEQLPYIFDRFYQADDSHTRPAEGTGIGLALTRELVKLMQGTIEVSSTPGQGTTFRLLLPIRRTAARAAVPNSLDTFAENDLQAVVAETNHISTSTPQPTATDRPSLLLVEDHADVVSYLHDILDPHYRLLTAGNGKSGLKLAHRYLPDLILSDVMMPEMDGYELCQQLKGDPATAHIPILLLTAKADIDSRLIGFGQGADAYLAKPFVERELLVRLQQLYATRLRLRTYYTSTAFLSGQATTPPPEGHSVHEQAFLTQLIAVVEEHLADPTFSAQRLSELLHMSYSTCLRKVKTTTGMTVIAYIRHIRVHRAARLLREQPTRTLTDIGQEVGFSSAAYFSRAFKKVMGVSPKAFRLQE